MGEHDGVTVAFDAMAQVAEQVSQDSQKLADQSRAAGAERAAGASMTEVMDSGRPQAVLKLAESLAKRLVSAASVLRHAVVRDLSSEGKKVSAIARIFGVSHQRISVLLKARHQND
ncbi:MAG TPA: hypothetical protein VFN61_04650 [Acidimicrobiales bacterium]|nr:hypothetical protein [Acidimicrobiales bacterium]